MASLEAGRDRHWGGKDYLLDDILIIYVEGHVVHKEGEREHVEDMGG